MSSGIQIAQILIHKRNMHLVPQLSRVGILPLRLGVVTGLNHLNTSIAGTGCVEVECQERECGRSTFHRSCWREPMTALFFLSTTGRMLVGVQDGAGLASISPLTLS